MTNTKGFPELQAMGSEQQLAQRWHNELQPFWQQLQHQQLQSFDNRSLYYHFHRPAQASTAIIISSGRIETAIKYSELMFDLVSAGYAVYIVDHRGQGQSERLLADRQKGYVGHFSDYQRDLNQFVQQIVLPSGHQRHLLLCHSMGAAIACYPPIAPAIDALILCSPMFGIHTGIVPTRLAETMCLHLARIEHGWPGRQHGFLPGQGPYRAKHFAGNPLTQSEARLAWMQQLYRDYPDLQLGGVTLHWLSEAIMAMRLLQHSAAQLTTPVLLLQAAADKIVSNSAQDRWFARLPQTLLRQKVTLAGARHEILMETDPIRQQAFAAINQFLTQLDSL
ncbi:alpha/beta fold hydrolase [Arsukibacterium sp.]|uniref:alpha/beta fold hydrolase n=1 Tax=Arsukibacterium sp. TaxID=1977258 RepID=UPI002FDAD058